MLPTPFIPAQPVPPTGRDCTKLF